MFVGREIINGITVLHISGEVVQSALQENELRDEIRMAFVQGSADVVLDISKVTKLDSYGIGQLVAGRNFVAEHCKRFRLCGADQTITRVLATMRLQEALGLSNAGVEDVLAELTK